MSKIWNRLPLLLAVAMAGISFVVSSKQELEAGSWWFVGDLIITIIYIKIFCELLDKKKDF